MTEKTEHQELPFKQLKVLDLAWVVAGPVIGRMLADFGATVVRVESSLRVDTARVIGPFPGGVLDKEHSGLYENCNAGKLSMAIDLSSRAGQAVVRDLVAWADILIESFSPGQMARWGLAYEHLREINPFLVMVSTSLMGQSGPYASYAGYGNVGAAMAGFQNLVGEPGKMPIGPFGPFTDFVGPRFATVALLGALDHRRRTGEGCWLDISQAEAGIQLLSPQVADYSCSGTVASPIGNRDTAMAPHGVFRCKREGEQGSDHGWVAISVRNDAEWEMLALLMGGAALAADERFTSLLARKANEDALEATIAAWCASEDAQGVEDSLQRLHIPAHVVASSADMLRDPQLLARRHFIQLEHPVSGVSTVENARYLLSATPGEPVVAAPTLGRDTEYVLCRFLGYDQTRIESLSEAGILV